MYLTSLWATAVGAWSSPYSSLRAHLRLVRVPCFVKVSLSSTYIWSARLVGIPSHIRITTTMHDVSQECPGLSRTRTRSFSSTLARRITCVSHTPKDYISVSSLFLPQGVLYTSNSVPQCVELRAAENRGMV